MTRLIYIWATKKTNVLYWRAIFSGQCSVLWASTASRQWDVGMLLQMLYYECTSILKVKELCPWHDDHTVQSCSDIPMLLPGWCTSKHRSWNIVACLYDLPIWKNTQVWLSKLLSLSSSDEQLTLQKNKIRYRVYVIHYQVEHCDKQGHSSLTPYICIFKEWTLAKLRAWNSYPQLEISHIVEWRSLNYAFRYDAM